MLNIRVHLFFYFLLMIVVIGFLLQAINSLGLDITLAWNKDNKNSLAEYKIFFRTTVDSYNYLNPEWEGTETNYTIYNLKDKTNYCFMLRAFDNWGNECGHSNELCYEPMENSQGWHLISLPVLTESTLVSYLFPDAVVVYAYENKIGYVRLKESDKLQFGRGYWILFEKPQNYHLIGQPIKSYTYNVSRNGWYIIGGCTSLAHASADNCNIDVIYSYMQGTGYQRLLESENLESGKGYWALLGDVVDQAEIRVRAVKRDP